MAAQTPLEELTVSAYQMFVPDLSDVLLWAADVTSSCSGRTWLDHPARCHALKVFSAT